MLGQFDLVGIPPAPRGMPQVEVTFDIDANGIVNVSAKDKATNKEQAIRIQASGGLSEDEIETMVKDAEANAEADRKRKELVEARNQADSLIHTTESTLKEHGESISEEDKSAIESATAELKTAIEAEDVDEIKAKTEALAQASMKLGEAMYKAQQEQAGAEEPQSNDGPGGEDDSVVDADYEEVDDDKKAG
jgi:molecular chaperone DnaK